jgi:SAM-dependent methyltransferase
MHCRICGVKATAFVKISTDELDEPFLDEILREQLPELLLSRCNDCGCLWATDGRQREEILLQAYSRLQDSYYEAEQVSQRHSEFYGWLETLLQKHKAGRSILDVGCGDGSFLAALSDKWIKRGIDPSTAGTEISKQKKLDVTIGTLDSEPYQADLISALDVIEHVVDPHVFVESIRKHLNPNGTVLLLTGDSASYAARVAGAQWSYLRWCGHISVFSAHGLKRLLESHDFEILDWKRCEHPSSAGSIAWWRVHTLEPLRRALGRARSWYPFWRDHQVLVARLRPR